MKERSTRGKLPIYNVTLELVLTDNIERSQVKQPRAKMLGNQKPVGAAGLCIYRNWNYCLMFDRRYLDHNLIAHECFHVTHRIADYCGLKFRISKHEEYAHLNGFITNFVYNQLKEWKIRVK